jgi:hypothetical protein
VHIRKGNEECCIGGGYNKSDGDGIARILKEHIGKTNIEETFIGEIVNKGAGYARIFGGDMNMDWDNTSISRKRIWEGALANTELANTYISREQKTKIDRAIVEGGHINAKQISDKPPGLLRHRMILIDMTNELSMRLEMETSGEMRPAPSPILETNGENTRKLRK